MIAVPDVGPTLYKCYANVSCLLGYVRLQTDVGLCTELEVNHRTGSSVVCV